MKLEIATRQPRNRYKGDVVNSNLSINGIPIDISQIQRVEFRNGSPDMDGQIQLKDGTFSFKFRWRGVFRKRNVGNFQGFVELRVASLQSTIKVGVEEMDVWERLEG
jgi:hypothetical protein